MIVELNNLEYVMCTQIAMMRHERNRNSKVQDKIIWTDVPKMHVETLGVMGEFAFCKWANKYPPLDTSPQSGTTDIIYDQWKCDIKVTERKDGRLIVSQWKKKESSDVYILGIVDGLTVDFVGFATNDEIFDDARLKDLGRAVCYCMDQSELTRFKDEPKVA